MSSNRYPPYPIWYVVFIRERDLSLMGVWHVLRIVPADLSQLDELYQKYLAPLHASGTLPGAQAIFLARFPTQKSLEMLEEPAAHMEIFRQTGQWPLPEGPYKQYIEAQRRSWAEIQAELERHEEERAPIDYANDKAWEDR